MPNKQTNKIRLCKKTQRKIKQGNVIAIEKVEKEISNIVSVLWLQEVFMQME